VDRSEWKPTARQTQLIQLFCEGRTASQVGAVMGYGKGTAKNYLYRIYKILGFTGSGSSGHCKLRLLKWAIKNKIVTL
jgi:DNA-binding NarL/FixJ family response regulator